jgi:hypothetical protein
MQGTATAAPASSAALARRATHKGFGVSLAGLKAPHEQVWPGRRTYAVAGQCREASFAFPSPRAMGTGPVCLFVVFLFCSPGFPSGLFVCLFVAPILRFMLCEHCAASGAVTQALAAVRLRARSTKRVGWRGCICLFACSLACKLRVALVATAARCFGCNRGYLFATSRLVQDLSEASEEEEADAEGWETLLVTPTQ